MIELASIKMEKLLILILTIMVTNSNCGDGPEASQSQKIVPLIVRKCSDFDLRERS